MKKLQTILILLIVFVICSAITYSSIKGVTRKSNDTNSSSRQKQETNKNDIKVDESKIYDSIDKFSVFEGRGVDITVSKFSNSDLIFFIFANNELELTLPKAQAYTIKYLGRKVEPGDMPCPNNSEDESLIIFDKDNQKFIINPEHPGHGGGGVIINTINKIDSINVNNDEITVTVKKVFSEYVQDTGYNMFYYYSFEDMIKENDSKIAFIDIDPEDVDDYLGEDNEYKDKNFTKSKIDYSKASTYEYKLKMIDDNYVIKSYKKIKG